MATGMGKTDKPPVTESGTTHSQKPDHIYPNAWRQGTRHLTPLLHWKVLENRMPFLIPFNKICNGNWTVLCVKRVDPEQSSTNNIFNYAYTLLRPLEKEYDIISSEQNTD